MHKTIDKTCTMAGAGQSTLLTGLRTYGHAFTMAEILLSLTIIGVVAAITLPSLTGNINERTWNTQRKALYARMSQAIALMPALNGYGTLKEASSEGASDAVDTAAETFVTDGLSKVLKINNICDNEHLEDCGVVASFTNMTGSLMSTPTTLYELNSHFKGVSHIGNSFSAINTKAAAFETQNGETIVAYYNKSCRTDFLMEQNATRNQDIMVFPQTTMCVNFIYDLNGNKGPNTYGKDIGSITVFNATDSLVVAPLPSSTGNATDSSSWYDAASACTTQNTDSRVPNIYELEAMLINRYIINLAAPVGGFWSGSTFDSRKGWTISIAVDSAASLGKIDGRAVRCIKR